jgi:uncharacterized protein
MVNSSPIFHLAIPINDLSLAKEFYRDGLGCQVGRANLQAMILNFYGHQLVAHMTKEKLQPQKGVYPRHFGLVFPSKATWDEIVLRAKTQHLKFYQQPKLRFAEQLTEHWTFFLEDPFYNLLEFKYYAHSVAIFEQLEIQTIGDR